VLLSSAIMTHFSGTLSSDIVTAKREFPSTARVDLQKAIEQALEGHISAKVLGIHREYSHSTVTFSDLLHDSNYPAVIGPLAYDEIDTGDEFPSRCLNQALFLAETNELKFALLLAQVEKYGQAGGTMIEIAVPAGENGLDLSRSLLDQIEKLVARSGSYRGKVLSLEE
ncbi:hypothetical protein, partial [Klebsiella aerogenes]|uniref:hypothetical protein n=1 Tax=Klebsiella aerogenes TaxID=548 RepID=UPI001C3759ED